MTTATSASVPRAGVATVLYRADMLFCAQTPSLPWATAVRFAVIGKIGNV